MSTPATSRAVISGLVSFLALFILGIPSAHAIPAFALREKVSCAMCHTNGSAPHLTKFGYLYRRAGFRLPDNIGNKEEDDKHMVLTQHMAAGVNLDYEYATSTAPGATSATTNSNQINVPEVELWPAVGSFMGNFAVWSELDMVPSAQTLNGTNQVSVELSQADLRYARGNKDMFFNFRGGMIAPEGFGASDQWLDDGNIPAMESVSGYYNQDTLALPFGAMETPELGFEFGFNYYDSHLTLGMYNGFTSTTGTVSPALMNSSNGYPKDYKVQLDQFVGDLGAVTAAYYTGNTFMTTDPTGTALNWNNAYNMWRLYVTAFAIPSKLDILAGGGLDNNQFINAGNATPVGSFTSLGGFVGALFYPMPHLTLGARVDYKGYSNTASPTGTPVPGGQALGYSLQASLPYENNIYVIRFNHMSSAYTVATLAAGQTDDFRAEWRFLF